MLLLLLGVVACENSSERSDGTLPADYITLQGKTMGTTYQVTYADPQKRNLQEEIDAKLVEVNKGVNTYDPSSLISQFNQAEEQVEIDPSEAIGQHFMKNLELARRVYQTSGGDFDPTVMPLVNYWGFGYDGSKKITEVDSSKVDSLLQYIGMNKVIYDEPFLSKENAGVQIDFSACAKGYGVDEVARLLESKGIDHYLIDIGGEVRGKGMSSRGDEWRLGINTPKEGTALDDYELIVKLSDFALATSGNYRNFYEVNGVKYSHTINPNTGFPERNTLLSASVFAGDCMTADAYATAFMVMGLERAYDLANQVDDIEALFIYGDESGEMQVKYTAGVEAFLAKD